MKKVSVIIPCYNQGIFLDESINSVLKQTYKNIEIILVNDCSYDNTKEIAEKYLSELENFIFINNEQNLGVASSRNLAIEKSSGDYILPLDADDIIEPTYIEKAVKILDSDKSIGIVYCKARFFGKKSGEWKLPDFNIDDFLITNSIFCTALFRKDDFEKAGKYDDSMKTDVEDWDFWLSMLDLGIKPYRIPEFLFNYRKHKSNKRIQSLPIRRYIFNKHLNLYLSRDSIIQKIFFNENKNFLEKYRKYKKLFNYLLYINIILIFIILLNIL